MRVISRVSLSIAFSILPACGVVQGVAAQTAGAIVPIPAVYADEPIVLVSLDDVFRMQADGTGVQERTVVARIQAESALKQMAVLSLAFAANSQRVEWVYARLRHSDGTVTETLADSAIEVAEQVTREAPFYSDLKESQLPLKNLRVGDQLEWKGRIIRSKAEAPGEFWNQGSFEKDGVILSETLELDAPRETSLNVWSPKWKPVERTEGERHIYRWSSANRKPTVGPLAEAVKEAEKKRVRSAEEELDEREGKLPDVAWTTFKSWQAVGAWYRGLEGERMAPDAEIKTKVAQLTSGKTTEEAKVQAVYGYVSTQVHYIGVAFGVGRYQPHSAADVLANQYGDCKDKHTLLASMLEVLGLHPDAVLIGAGIRFNPAVPSPQAFNHLITRVAIAGNVTWLDATAEVAPFGMLVFPTRDKDALVVPESGVAEVRRTPKRPPFAASMTMTSVGKLDAEGLSNSRITWTMRGDDELVVRTVFRQVSPAQYDQLVQRICGGIGYGGTVSHVEVSRNEDTDTPFKLSFDYKRDKAGDWDNLKTVPQLYPVLLPQPDEKEPPVESLQLGVARVETSNAEMTLPQGWVATLPEAVHVKSEWLNYDMTYRLDNGVLTSQRRLEVIAERVPVSDWTRFGKVAKTVQDDQFVQLIRNDKGSGGASESAANAPARKLVQQAYDAIKGKDLVSGESLLNQATAIDPKQPSLWSGYGNLSLARGDRAGAIKNYQKELDLHPEETRLYPVIATIQMQAGRKADAKEILVRWAAAAPDDPAPHTRIAQLQYADGEYAAAVTSAKEASALSQGDAAEKSAVLLGQYQLKAGQTEDGHRTLLDLVNRTEDPDLMNDAAYELANAGLELPLADKVTRAALARLEEESRSWTLDEDFKKLQTRTANLEATWDTMGWVLFREGKVSEAEAFIKASWSAFQSAEVGKHLGEIALAKGDRNAALTYFDMAITASSPGDLQKQIMAEAEALRKQGAHPATSDAAAALQKLRTLTIGPGANGFAEYKVLMNAQGVVKAEPAGEKLLPDAMKQMNRAKAGAFFPPGSQAQLVMLRILNCHQGTCELVAER